MTEKYVNVGCFGRFPHIFFLPIINDGALTRLAEHFGPEYERWYHSGPDVLFRSDSDAILFKMKLEEIVFGVPE